MAPITSPFNLWLNAMQMTMIAAEAQWVIGLRMMGMAGVWSVSPSENARMISEKTSAFSRSLIAAQAAVLSGKSGEAAVSAALRPIRQTTRANYRRLSRRGPRQS